MLRDSTYIYIYIYIMFLSLLKYDVENRNCTNNNFEIIMLF